MRKSPTMALAGALLALGWSLVGTGSAGAAGRGQPGADTAQAAANRVVCYQAHVAGIGWENAYSCNGATAGTTGEGRAVEALRFVTIGMSGLCARAHVSTIGWQSWICAGDSATLEIGTAGRSLTIEAVEFQTQSGSVAANAHLSGYGWQGWVAGGRVTVGTTGENRSIEALMVTP
ncbi:hypothetical protein OG875_02640 [Streptomyces sp. NBC_01498]|uniref:hypothetical protein n=1 Tax=Streptomyces sp. NBC_01498 TaxID=2975870 RepID=UPI002E7B375A|nr:hypothetical protein [Streptomyces sp. NBC_01498]WTL23595.1 hypothetical protein OG875_02640 [Streptomyces sp. NBC_01498]